VLKQPIFAYSLVLAILAGAAGFLPADVRGTAWWTLAATFVLLVAWGTVHMRSGLFGRVITAGPRGLPRVALTYDDGPHPAATAALLDLLRHRGVRATFFVVGTRAVAHPDLVRRCVAEGHLLGNHTQRHSNLTNLLHVPYLRRELEECQGTVAAIAGERPRFYRPPVGLMNPLTCPVASSAGLTPVGWDVRSLDTLPLSAERVARRVLSRVRPGSIVVLHDGGPDPVRARDITERILDGLAERGLDPVRLDALLSPGAGGAL
jgi:peptidoglycan/xylan/chitin deacetylase (PgdA/CDA1 family)